MGQRVCSLSLAASGLNTDSIFEESAKLGFPVQDQKLRAFLKVSNNFDPGRFGVEELFKTLNGATESAFGDDRR
jgi:hypothetical protein